jgi:hypothetical protein
LTAFTLKLIALACMFMDHLAAVFPQYFPFIFRNFGRVAMPLFVYFVAEGCRRTGSMPRYLARLGLFALVSQIPFSLAFSYMRHRELRFSFLSDTNIFYTLFLGALCVFIFQKLKELRGGAWLIFFPLAVLMFIADRIGADYGGRGVLFLFLMYVIPEKRPRIIAMAAFMLFMYGNFLPGALFSGIGIAPYMNVRFTGMLAGGLASAVLAALYNGERGPGMKWFFYAAYPAHLLLLGGAFWLTAPV